jgi:hypothetical protein
MTEELVEDSFQVFIPNIGFKISIDLMFHTPDVFIDELRSLEHFGSDHFPIYAKFFINKNTSKQEHLKEKLEEGEHEIVQE